VCVFQYLSTYLSTKNDFAIKHDLIYYEFYNNFMVTLKEMKEVIDHVSNQNDVIVCTLIKILEAIDNKEIQGIKVMLTEKALQN